MFIILRNISWSMYEWNNKMSRFLSNNSSNTKNDLKGDKANVSKYL